MSGDRRQVSTAYLAAQTGFSARWFTAMASQGRIPGACQPAGPRGGWRFDERMFWTWWNAASRA